MTSSVSLAEPVVRCARAGCGRRLTSAASIKRGVGPTCARKLAAQQADIKARFPRDMVRRAIGLISQGRATPIPGTRRFMVVGTNDTYIASAVGCNCPAGRKPHDCYHYVAAKLLTA